MVEIENLKMLTEEIVNDNDVIITLPKSVKWEDYLKELKAVEDGKQILNFKVNHLPKTNVGNRCYLVHNGFIIGWMKIVGLKNKSFTCGTTGRKWEGNFIERSGKFNYLNDKIPMKGFQGFRYFKK